MKHKKSVRIFWAIVSAMVLFSMLMYSVLLAMR